MNIQNTAILFLLITASASAQQVSQPLLRNILGSRSEQFQDCVADELVGMWTAIQPQDASIIRLSIWCNDCDATSCSLVGTHDYAGCPDDLPGPRGIASASDGCSFDPDQGDEGLFSCQATIKCQGSKEKGGEASPSFLKDGNTLTMSDGSRFWRVSQ